MTARDNWWAGPVVSTLLIMGGTADARALAAAVLARRPKMRVITSLAGRTAVPRKPMGEVTVGGFGGAQGLADYMLQENVDGVIDATHPFAAAISANVAEASRMTGVPRLVLMRASWTFADDAGVVRVADTAAAARALDKGDRRVFLAIGRKEVSAFTDMPGRFHLLRFIDAPDVPPPFADCHVLTGRPGGLEAEERILDEFRIDALVAKNGGSDASRAKIDAALDRGIKVVLIDPPPAPPLPHGDSIDAALEWLAGLSPS